MTKKEPGIIDDIMANDISKHIQKKLEHLPLPIRNRAYSAIQALNWTNRIFAIDLPVPSSFTALHATEEAVAALITCAKYCDYGKEAKINIKDHRQKALIVFLLSELIEILIEFNLEIAFDNDSQKIAIKYVINNSTQHSIGQLSVFCFMDQLNMCPENEFMDLLIERNIDLKSILNKINELQNIRNKLFYADDEGYPTGFIEPVPEIRKECHKTLALLWACVDIYENRNDKIPLVQQTLRTAQMLIKEFEKKKTTCKCKN